MRMMLLPFPWMLLSAFTVQPRSATLEWTQSRSISNNSSSMQQRHPHKHHFESMTMAGVFMLFGNSAVFIISGKGWLFGGLNVLESHLEPTNTIPFMSLVYYSWGLLDDDAITDEALFEKCLLRVIMCILSFTGYQSRSITTSRIIKILTNNHLPKAQITSLPYRFTFTKDLLVTYLLHPNCQEKVAASVTLVSLERVLLSRILP